MADDKPAFDPSQPFQPASKPAFNPKQSFQALPPAEPTETEKFMGGLTSSGEGIVQGLSHVIPSGPKADISTLPFNVQRAPPAPKPVKREPVSELDPARIAGEMADPLNYIAPAGIGKVLPRAGSLAKNVLGGAVTSALQPTSDKDFATGKIAQLEHGAEFGAGASVLGKAGSKGVDALGAYLAREFPENVRSQAVQKILKRFEQDKAGGGLTAQQAMDVVNEASTRGTPLTMADVGGKRVKALAGNVYREGGPAQGFMDQLLESRDKGAASRMSQSISENLHGGPSMQKTTKALIEARSAAGKPAWDDVRAMGGIWSPRLQQFIDDRAVKAGLSRGYEIERLESLAENRPFNPTQMGVDLDAEGNIKLLATPNMRVLHMGKMGLDAMIADERNELTGRLSQRGVALDKVRRAYIGEIDKLDTKGTYANARALWEGPSASMDQIRAGRAAFQSSPEEISEQMANLSPSGREFYRIGIADAVRERLAKTGVSGDEAKSLIKNPWVKDQLKPVFRSDKEFDDFAQSVAWESEMFGTKFATKGGSQTAERAAEDSRSEAAMGVAHLAKNVASGSYLAATSGALRLWRAMGFQPNEKVNEEVARILFATPINKGGELEQRLSGKFNPPPVNPLASAARKTSNVGTVLNPVFAAGQGETPSQPSSYAHPYDVLDNPSGIPVQ
jgi:hypothetical protein